MNNPYENKTMHRAACDFAVDPWGRAWIPNAGALRNLPGYTSIGKEFGPVTVLSEGMQSVYGQQGELSRIRLFGNGRSAEPLHHYAFYHGRSGDLERKAVIGFVQQCPGMLFELSCGCGGHRNQVVDTIFRTDASAGILVSFDTLTRKIAKRQLADSMLESLGVREASHFVTVRSQNSFEHECALQDKLLQESGDRKLFYGPSMTPFLLTHDLPVTSNVGKSARLLVIQEPPKDERKDFNRVTKQYYVLVVGDPSKKEPVVRYHSECVTADHGSNACDCNQQRLRALQYMWQHGSGIFIHGPEDGMDLGKVAKLPQTFLTVGGVTDLYTAREKYLDIPADLRKYHVIDVVRKILGVQSAMLASNNLSKRDAFEAHGIQISGSYPMRPDYSTLSASAMVDRDAKVGSQKYMDY